MGGGAGGREPITEDVREDDGEGLRGPGTWRGWCGAFSGGPLLRRGWWPRGKWSESSGTGVGGEGREDQGENALLPVSSDWPAFLLDHQSGAGRSQRETESPRGVTEHEPSWAPQSSQPPASARPRRRDMCHPNTRCLPQAVHLALQKVSLRGATVPTSHALLSTLSPRASLIRSKPLDQNPDSGLLVLGPGAPCVQATCSRRRPGPASARLLSLLPIW